MKSPIMRALARIVCVAVLNNAVIVPFYAANSAAVSTVAASKVMAKSKAAVEAKGCVFEALVKSHPKKLKNIYNSFCKVSERLRNNEGMEDVDYDNMILLLNKPGIGVGPLARNIAKGSSAPLFELNGLTIASGYVETGSHAISKKYQEVSKWVSENNQAAVFVIHGIDELFKIDEKSEGYTLVIQELQAVFDEITKDHRILFIATASTNEKFDQSLLDYLENIYVLLPDKRMRREFIQLCVLENHIVPISKSLEDDLVEKTEGASLFLLEEILKMLSDGVSAEVLEKGVINITVNFRERSESLTRSSFSYLGLDAAGDVVARAEEAVEGWFVSCEKKEKQGHFFNGMVGEYPRALTLFCGKLKEINEALKNGSRRRKKYKYITANIILLYGEPGNGKTTIARKIAEETGSKLFEVNGTTLVNKYVGSGTDAVKEKCDEVLAWVKENNQTAVFMVDEFDTVTKNSEHSTGKDEYEKTVNGMHIVLDKIEKCDRVLFVATTNHKEKMDKALLTRMEEIRISMPGAVIRRAFLKDFLEKKDEDPLGQELEDFFVDQTDGLCIRDLDKILNMVLGMATLDNKPIDKALLEKQIKLAKEKLEIKNESTSFLPRVKEFGLKVGQELLLGGANEVGHQIVKCIAKDKNKKE